MTITKEFQVYIEVEVTGSFLFPFLVTEPEIDIYFILIISSFAAKSVYLGNVVCLYLLYLKWLPDRMFH